MLMKLSLLATNRSLLPKAKLDADTIINIGITPVPTAVPFFRDILFIMRLFGAEWLGFEI